MAKASTQPPAVNTPKVVVWTRDLNFESRLNEMNLSWVYQTGIKFTDVTYTTNPSRLDAPVDKDRVLEIGFKILEYGLQLPALLVWDDKGRQELFGGYHRSAACKEAEIKTCSAYVVKNVGRSTMDILAVVDNQGGRCLTAEEVMHQAIVHMAKYPEEDTAKVADFFMVKPDRLKRGIKIHQFLGRMSQPSTFVPHRENLTPSVIERLANVANRCNDTILFDMAATLAKFKKVTEAQAKLLIDTVVETQPRTDDAMRTTLRNQDQLLTGQLLVREGKTKGRSRRFSIGERMGVECQRLITSTDILDSRDPRELFPAEKERESFMSRANAIIKRFRTALNVLKEGDK